jgi:putative transposase
VFIWRKSNHQRDTEAQLRKLEDHIAQQRWYFWHTVTDYLSKTYSLIALEDIDFEFMRKNRRLSMPAADASFSMFRQMLEYKAERTGARLVYVRAAYTSQTCSACGCIDSENRRTQAAFRCVACGHEENADINAAKNILARGLATLAAVCEEST